HRCTRRAGCRRSEHEHSGKIERGERLAEARREPLRGRVERSGRDGVAGHRVGARVFGVELLQLEGLAGGRSGARDHIGGLAGDIEKPPAVITDGENEVGDTAGIESIQGEYERGYRDVRLEV